MNKSLAYVGNVPTVKTPKSKAGNRVVPIPDILFECLRKARQKAPICRLFYPDTDGGHLRETSYRSSWESYWRYLNERAGGTITQHKRDWTIVIDRITAHMLRHTYASLLYDSNVDIKSAQAFLGHSNIQITLKVYTHLSQRKAGQSIDNLNAMLNRAFGSKKEGAERQLEHLPETKSITKV